MGVERGWEARKEFGARSLTHKHQKLDVAWTLESRHCHVRPRRSMEEDEDSRAQPHPGRALSQQHLGWYTEAVAWLKSRQSEGALNWGGRAGRGRGWQGRGSGRAPLSH